jgi:hypothetical protein
MYLRHLDNNLLKHFDNYKQVLILLGSRQVGKTTIIKKIFKDFIYLLVDNEPVRKILETYDIENYKILLENKKYLIIDEIHLLKDPGRAVKIFYDNLPNLKIIITGSSAFHIKNKTTESLAGRKIDYYLFPLTFSEILKQKEIIKKLDFNIFNNLLLDNLTKKKLYKFNLKEILNNILIYGQYPELVNLPQDKKYLLNFVDSLIFKDILELNLIENKKIASDLLKVLAYQIGNIINYTEIANKLKIDQRTVKRYIQIFEDSFIIYRLYPYSKNKRNEIVKSPKIYFYDTGIRNALIEDFNDIYLRNDKGALFENFIIGEFIKANNYLDENYKIYYWRTKSGSEIDLVITKKEILLGVEIKYQKNKLNTVFKNKYKQAKLKNINSDNFY